MENPKPFAAILTIIVCIIVIVGLVGYIFILKARNASDSKVTATQTAALVGTQYDGTENWQNYSNDEAGFSIKYPDKIANDLDHWIYKVFADPTLVKQTINFGPPSSAQGGYVWAITVADKSKGCEVYGNQFANKEPIVDNVSIDGRSAKLTTVRVESLPDWISRSVCITTAEKSITISNGAIDRPEFEEFYKSFKFIN